MYLIMWDFSDAMVWQLEIQRTWELEIPAFGDKSTCFRVYMVWKAYCLESMKHVSSRVTVFQQCFFFQDCALRVMMSRVWRTWVLDLSDLDNEDWERGSGLLFCPG